MSINTPLPPCPEITMPLFALIDRLVGVAIGFRWSEWTPAAATATVVIAATVAGSILALRSLRGSRPADQQRRH